MESRYLTKINNLYEYIPLGVLIIDHTGKIMEFNNIFAALTGIAEKKNNTENISSLLPPEVFNQDKIKKYKFPLRAYDVLLTGVPSVHVYIDLTIDKIKIENEELFIFFFQDVSERKLKEKELISEEERFRLLTETSLDGISILDNKGNFVFCNGTHADITGYEFSDVEGKNLREFAPEDKGSEIKALINEVVNGNTIQLQIMFTRKNGEQIPVYLSFAPIYKEENVTGIMTVVRDISLYKNYENRLREDEARLSTLVNNIPAILWTTNKNNVITSISGAGLTNLNINLTQALNRSVEYFFNDILNIPDYNVRTSEALEGANIKYDVKIENTVFEIVINPLYDDDSITGTIGLALDISDSMQKDRKIMQLSTAVEQSAVSVIITDLAGNIEYVNRKFSELTGYTKEEVYNKNPRLLKSGVTSQKHYENLWRKIKSGEEWRGEFLNKKKNGELFWERAVISPVKNNNGEIINYLAVKEDITDLKNIEEELENHRKNLAVTVEEKTNQLIDTEKRLSTMAGLSNDVMMRLRDDGYIFYANPAAQQLFGDSIIDKNNLTDIESKKELVSFFIDEIKVIKEEKKQRHTNVQFQNEIWFDWFFIPEINTDKKLVSILIYGRDITEQKTLEQNIRDALIHERELNRIKTEFISMASHEFRTPLTTILASADLLEMFGLNWTEEKFREHIGKIQKAVGKLTVLLEEVLTLNRFGNIAEGFNPGLTDIKYLINGIINEFNIPVFPVDKIYVYYKVKNFEFIIDSRLFRLIIRNIILYFISKSGAEKPVKLEISDDADYLIVSVFSDETENESLNLSLLLESLSKIEELRKSGKGSLSLSIIYDACKRHQAVIRICRLEEGGKETICIMFPKEY